MGTKTMLDKVSATIERVVKDSRGAAAVQTKKRMPLSDFVSYALAQIEKAAQDEPDAAARRLGLLKRSVDGALARLAKLNPEDTESEDVEVEVLTAWAPSKGEGDDPIDELTTAGDQSVKETLPASIESALGDSAFAQNLDEVAKALRKMKEELEAKQEKKERAPAKKSEGPASDAWPLDLNSEGFRKGVEKADSAPSWGYDPEGVASPKAE
jgi:hypothetical protein